MSNKRRKGRGPLTVFVLAALVAGLAMAFVPQYWQYFVPDPDRYQLAYERKSRLSWHRSGLDLAGTPDYKQLTQRLETKNLKLGAPIFIRIFKREFKLELWIKRNGRFHHFQTYPICRYSGRLGPKLKQGDHQAPEGVYTVSKGQLNPNSRWRRSFNLGYPNTYDRAHARTGNYLMVHGGCSSVGCYAMTNDGIDEIWKIVTSALNGGQKRFQVQVLPFKMTDHALAQRKNHKWAPFWQQLKPAYDIFETTRVPPVAAVCNRRYSFKPAPQNANGSAKITKSCKGVNARSTSLSHTP